jgi:hypothetical protein
MSRPNQTNAIQAGMPQDGWPQTRPGGILAWLGFGHQADSGSAWLAGSGLAATLGPDAALATTTAPAAATVRAHPDPDARHRLLAGMAT